MVTGDHIETARWVAIQCGIIDKEEAYEDGVAMTGDEFQHRIGGYERVWNETTENWDVRFDDDQKFKDVRKKLKIIARTTSEDKFVLVAGTKMNGGLVAVTGDSITDAESLQKADVGICMGSGCEVAKDNSDLIIMDNDFYSIYRSIKWGKAIYVNIRKFIQFQLTINIVICFITVIGGCTIGRTPLNIIQMLWVNLIMDVLGAIALGTESPGNENISRISRKEGIINAIMWRQILCMALYQIIVMLIFMYFGEMMLFKDSFNLITAL
jgi:Ca2+-transporting ATPase